MKENIREEEILKIIKEKGQVTRLELSIIFNLTLARISKLTKNLLEKEMLIEVSSKESTGGRKPSFLSVNYRKLKKVLGLNFTASSTLYIILGSINGDIITKEKIQLKPQDKLDILEVIDNIIERKLNSHSDIGALSLVMPGIINEDRGVSILSPHYNLKTPNIKEYLEDKYELPTLLENDVRAMALAERQIGQCRDTKNFVVFNLSEGIGSTSCINGRVYKGYNFMAGEAGHIVINTNSIRKCTCGKRGCLESEASESAIIKKITSEIKIGKYSILKKQLSEKSSLSIKDILWGVEKKDFLVIQVMTEAIENIAKGLNILISVLDPEKIILVGEIFTNKYLMDTLKFELNKISLNIQTHSINPTKLGEEMHYYSPLAIIIDQVFKNKDFSQKYIS